MRARERGKDAVTPTYLPTKRTQAVRGRRHPAPGSTKCPCPPARRSRNDPNVQDARATKEDEGLSGRRAAPSPGGPTVCANRPTRKRVWHTPEKKKQTLCACYICVGGKGTGALGTSYTGAEVTGRLRDTSLNRAAYAQRYPSDPLRHGRGPVRCARATPA